MQDFGADTKDTSTDEEGEIEIPPTTSVEDPVETCCEEKECEEVEDFIVDYGVDLQCRKTCVACGKQEEEEST